MSPALSSKQQIKTGIGVALTSSGAYDLLHVSLAACFVQESSLGARLQAVGNGSQVESVTQTSVAEACTCAAQEMTSRTISNKNDILLPMMAGQMSSDHEALDTCKLYEMCWYAQNPVVSMDTMFLDILYVFHSLIISCVYLNWTEACMLLFCIPVDGNGKYCHVWIQLRRLSCRKSKFYLSLCKV